MPLQSLYVHSASYTHFCALRPLQFTADLIAMNSADFIVTSTYQVGAWACLEARPYFCQCFKQVSTLWMQ